MDIYAKLDKLSNLSRETNGASFNIQHEKSTGLYKVAFSNVMMTSKRDLKPKAFDDAIDDAIAFIESNRVAVDVPIEKYTMFK